MPPSEHRAPSPSDALPRDERRRQGEDRGRRMEDQQREALLDDLQVLASELRRSNGTVHAMRDAPRYAPRYAEALRWLLPLAIAGFVSYFSAQSAITNRVSRLEERAGLYETTRTELKNEIRDLSTKIDTLIGQVGQLRGARAREERDR